jgi:hypothetical protein
MSLAVDELEEAVSFRRNVTGIDHVIFILPHEIRVANPPDNLDPRGSATIGEIDPQLARQVQQFMAINRATLLDYWYVW